MMQQRMAVQGWNDLHGMLRFLSFSIQPLQPRDGAASAIPVGLHTFFAQGCVGVGVKHSL